MKKFKNLKSTAKTPILFQGNSVEIFNIILFILKWSALKKLYTYYLHFEHKNVIDIILYLYYFPRKAKHNVDNNMLK